MKHPKHLRKIGLWGWALLYGGLQAAQSQSLAEFYPKHQLSIGLIQSVQHFDAKVVSPGFSPSLTFDKRLTNTSIAFGYDYNTCKMKGLLLNAAFLWPGDDIVQTTHRYLLNNVDVADEQFHNRLSNRFGEWNVGLNFWTIPRVVVGGGLNVSDYLLYVWYRKTMGDRVTHHLTGAGVFLNTHVLLGAKTALRLLTSYARPVRYSQNSGLLDNIDEAHLYRIWLQWETKGGMFGGVDYRGLAGKGRVVDSFGSVTDIEVTNRAQRWNVQLGYRIALDKLFRKQQDDT